MEGEKGRSSNIAFICVLVLFYKLFSHLYMIKSVENSEKFW